MAWHVRASILLWLLLHSKDKCQVNVSERNYCIHSVRTPVNWNSLEMIAYALVCCSNFISHCLHSVPFPFSIHAYHKYNVTKYIVVASWYLSLSTVPLSPPKRNENTLLCLRFNYPHKLSLRNYNDQNAYNWNYFLLKCSDMSACIQCMHKKRTPWFRQVSHSTNLHFIENKMFFVLLHSLHLVCYSGVQLIYIYVCLCMFIYIIQKRNARRKKNID